MKIMFFFTGVLFGRSLVKRDPGYAIAAGLFAIAAQIGG